MSGRPRASILRPLESVALTVASLSGAWGCVSRSALDASIDRASQILIEADHNGALQCAPRELAIARSELEFAQLEIEQGFAARAEEHVRVATENAEAARILSPPDRCTPRPKG
jgi:OOP family OmpA-OmpF porin